MARAEENLEVRIILLKKTGQVLFQVGFVAVQWLQEAHRGQKVTRSGSGGAAAKAEDARGHHQAVDRRGGRSQNGKRKQRDE